jgi:glycosyltransferase involved in cell wall biosynthesis
MAAMAAFPSATAILFTARVRVTFLTQYFPPEVGAPQARIAALAKGLAGRGETVTVHTCPPHYPDGRIKQPYRNRPLRHERQEAVRVIRSAVYPAPNRGFLRRLCGHLSFAGSSLATAPLTGPADVVVVETPPLFLAAAAIGYARSKRARLIVNVADLWPDSAVELGALRSPAAIRAARALERAIYRAADAITCPTEGIAAALESRSEAAGKALLIRPAVDVERFDEAAAAPGGDLSGARVRVLYAGTVGMAHGLDSLLDAVDEANRKWSGPQVEAIIAGDGAEAPRLRSRLSSGGPSNVTMLGAVPGARIPRLYAECEIAVVLLRDRPIFHGALPTKLFEAMAAARPVIFAGRGEAADLLEATGAGVVVEPESPGALSSAIRALASDPERRAVLGQAGRSAVEASFARPRWLDRWQTALA